MVSGDKKNMGQCEIVMIELSCSPSAFVMKMRKSRSLYCGNELWQIGSEEERDIPSQNQVLVVARDTLPSLSSLNNAGSANLATEEFCALRYWNLFSATRKKADLELRCPASGGGWGWGWGRWGAESLLGGPPETCGQFMKQNEGFGFTGAALARIVIHSWCKQSSCRSNPQMLWKARTSLPRRP